MEINKQKILNDLYWKTISEDDEMFEVSTKEEAEENIIVLEKLNNEVKLISNLIASYVDENDKEISNSIYKAKMSIIRCINENKKLLSVM